MGCRHCFVVDRPEDLVYEGDSRSSSRVHEHDSYQLVLHQNVAIRVFWSRCQPRLTWALVIFITANNGSLRSIVFHSFDFPWTVRSSLRANNGSHGSIMIWVWIWLAWLGTLWWSSNFSFWLSSNFWTQFFHPVMFQVKSLEEFEVTQKKTFSYMTSSSFHPNNFRNTKSWECFVTNESVRSCLTEL